MTSILLGLLSGGLTAFALACAVRTAVARRLWLRAIGMFVGAALFGTGLNALGIWLATDVGIYTLGEFAGWGVGLLAALLATLEWEDERDRARPGSLVCVIVALALFTGAAVSAESPPRQDRVAEVAIEATPVDFTPPAIITHGDCGFWPGLTFQYVIIGIVMGCYAGFTRFGTTLLAIVPAFWAVVLPPPLDIVVRALYGAAQYWAREALALGKCLWFSYGPRGDFWHSWVPDFRAVECGI